MDDAMVLSMDDARGDVHEAVDGPHNGFVH